MIADLTFALTLAAAMLGADRFEVRERALAELDRWGWAAWPALKWAEAEGCPETLHRARRLLQDLREPLPYPREEEPDWGPS